MTTYNSISSATATLRYNGDYHLFYFSELLRRPVCAGTVKNRLGKLTDLVFSLTEPYPQAVGIYIEHGWGKPTEFVPWDKVLKIREEAIFVESPEGSEQYPPFVDQPGWILLDEHLMGRSVLDTDGRKVEVVNDVCLVYGKGRMLLVDVDISFNGFLRRLGLRRVKWIKNHLISWKYVQPLSLEDVVSTDRVSLSLTRKELLDLPSEDLADVLEELTGNEQLAVFSSLDSEKAAETLMEVEPRAQRQIVASLKIEDVSRIFSEMTVPQLADLFTVISYDQVNRLITLLPDEKAGLVRSILSEDEITAQKLLSTEFLSVDRNTTVTEVLDAIKRSSLEPKHLSYIYITNPDNVLEGVVDLRELVLAPIETTMEAIMITPVVSADKNDERRDLTEKFAKYNYRMIPVVNAQDQILGIIFRNDIMKSLLPRVKD